MKARRSKLGKKIFSNKVEGRKVLSATHNKMVSGHETIIVRLHKGNKTIKIKQL